jgi:hypothetical protein
VYLTVAGRPGNGLPATVQLVLEVIFVELNGYEITYEIQTVVELLDQP